MAYINIYLTNLGKYNEGELVGEWLELPCTDEEIEDCKKRIGISDEPDEHGRFYEEWFITDYESDIKGLSIGEYENLDYLNEVAESFEDIDTDVIEALVYFGVDLEDVPNKADDIMTWSGCHDMGDVAIEYANETGLLDSIPENLQNYFDFESFGRDMEIEGNFYFTESGDCLEYIG